MAQLSRRELLAAARQSPLHQLTKAAAKDHGFTICAFSKHFQWTDVKGAAETMRDLGYEGVDLTVRPAGMCCRSACRTTCRKLPRLSAKAG